MEDWAEIRRLHRAEQMPIKAIARRLGIGRNTVRRALAADGPPRYARPGRGSIVDAVEPQIWELLGSWPSMPATVIAERIGWDRSLTVLKDRVRELRPLFAPPDPASRTEYRPGELAQCDLWFPPVDVPLGFGQVGRPPVLVMVAGYSRVISAVMLPSRQSPDLLAGHPESKGLVERANGYLETSFLPGRVFASPADFNTQLADWLIRANARQHRRLGCRPVDRWAVDHAEMLALPPVAPVTGWHTTVRLPRDHYVRLDANDYSVHPVAVGRRVTVIADLEQLGVFCDGVEVARHQRCWARHQSITAPAHSDAAVELRAARRLAAVPTAVTEVEQRSLGDYDRMFGLTTDTSIDIAGGVSA